MAFSIEELLKGGRITGPGGRADRPVTFLPDPEPRERWATVISVDDHVVEPPEIFDGRFASKFADVAPRVIETDNGGQAWLWNGEVLPNVGFNAVAGRPREDYTFEPTRFDHMRPGAYDIKFRLREMDINGVWASVCFPSFLPGFVGQRLSLWPKDEELAWAAVRAYNDWHLESWAGEDPDRIIPNQLAWLRDPVEAGEEIRRNAARGFKAVTFSEAPHRLGLPSIHSGYWEPFFEACAETGTVVCLHVGSAGRDADHVGRRPGRRHRGAVRGVGVHLHLRLAVLGRCHPASGHQDLHVGGRDRLGGRRHRPGRPHERPGR